MGQYHLKLPKMGESVAEATVTKWLKQVGDTVSLDDPIVEIATDKVDTDVTSEVEGVILEQCFQENQVVQIGEVLVIIETEGEVPEMSKIPEKSETTPKLEKETEVPVQEIVTTLEKEINTVDNSIQANFDGKERFYSPLVRNIAKKELISQMELDQIPGTGKDQRLTKTDLLNYLKHRPAVEKTQTSTPHAQPEVMAPSLQNPVIAQPSIGGGDQILEMSRMEKLISKHMKSSLEQSAHVQSFIEVDVTHLWDWREQVKASFLKREGEKLTFTPLFMTAIIKALRDYPALNSSLDGDKIIIKKDINVGMATALPDGNLIVPVIKNADHLNLVGLTKAVNDLATRARNNNLKPEEIQNGTYTFTNIGNFGSIMGTPIINQPQVGILAIGVIRKMPAVIETPKGDFIGIRRKVILSHSYDHRIINGATGGLFVKRVAEYLENWEADLPF
ncbi:2-oxo acid dehydrogenase subunit E2 [Flavobacteriaceae bacterium]|jgi:2-oxoglutarate dehydrogenase E2 component (dihydrolipoamide succinyltransferase)|nr:2-oxo acid dehydrogenase subunit E2 [Flavobacteriaceae bacterium]MDA9587482.1 2-oxo acid dehydrogenase subunit E2 [Flavobacteriaceae bacterium]MDA9851237.1 2-oxo acid dehydrogenase subunit E2 [Flavobacteriaceae bacterium]MDC0386141.1 2-oxo acid dehydrogenase subunit E2 [Flavobacteriaceae bacterium]